MATSRSPRKRIPIVLRASWLRSFRQIGFLSDSIRARGRVTRVRPSLRGDGHVGPALIERLEDRALLSVVIGQNFTGNTLTDIVNLNSFGLAPPDTDGSVGTNNYVEFTNGTFAI